MGGSILFARIFFMQKYCIKNIYCYNVVRILDSGKERREINDYRGKSKKLLCV